MLLEPISSIETWAKMPMERTSIGLNGMTGTGKSAIARKVAHRFDSQESQERLGASNGKKRDPTQGWPLNPNGRTGTEFTAELDSGSDFLSSHVAPKI
jgi:Cdc6-like AAA superfamily ATPase